MKVESLRPYQKKVNVTVKVLKVNEAREVTSKLDDTKHNVTEALAGDDSATVLLTLWDDDIAKVEVGKSYEIVNGFTSLFKQSLRLNVGRYGELKESAEAIAEVNEEKNLSGSEGDTAQPEETAAAVEEASEEKEEAAGKAGEKPAKETAKKAKKEKAAEPEEEAAEDKPEEEAAEETAKEEKKEEAEEAPAEEAAAEEPAEETKEEETASEETTEEKKKKE